MSIFICLYKDRVLIPWDRLSIFDPLVNLKYGKNYRFFASVPQDYHTLLGVQVENRTGAGLPLSKGQFHEQNPRVD